MPINHRPGGGRGKTTSALERMKCVLHGSNPILKSGKVLTGRAGRCVARNTVSQKARVCHSIDVDRCISRTIYHRYCPADVRSSSCFARCPVARGASHESGHVPLCAVDASKKMPRHIIVTVSDRKIVRGGRHTESHVTCRDSCGPVPEARSVPARARGRARCRLPCGVTSPGPGPICE
jgi:hypothetical protein